ncbi:hypothetical protein AX16_008969 [Volvariella volvacea WC 439]|nr:hypothetical protein AX16_008969 [Volvariella volvacea WC 439]
MDVSRSSSPLSSCPSSFPSSFSLSSPLSEVPSDFEDSVLYPEAAGSVNNGDNERPAQSSVEGPGVFDWDAVNEDEDSELWMIRVPTDMIQPTHLQDLAFTLPPAQEASSSKGRTALSRYDSPLTLPPNWRLSTSIDVVAPKPIARHIVVSARPPIPTRPTPSSNFPLDDLDITKQTASSENSHILAGPSHTNPKRYSHPDELLKHRFMPYGSLASPPIHFGPNVDVTMDVHLVDYDVGAEEIVASEQRMSAKTRMKTRSTSRRSACATASAVRKRKHQEASSAHDDHQPRRKVKKERESNEKAQDALRSTRQPQAEIGGDLQVDLGVL